MYSTEVEKALRAAGVQPGDRIRISRDGKSHQGLLLPHTVGDAGCLVLKLDSGYNIGIQATDAKLEKAGGEREEFGRVSQSLLQLTFDPRRPAVALVSSGGTIASRVDYRTGGVHAVEDPREFLHNVPELAEAINLVSISKPVSRMSEDMGHADWTAIAKAVFQELKKDVRGVILTHGTDTMHYTAAALSFFLRDLPKPVVMVGSQISSDRGSSDAGMNLICAAHAALSDIAEVGVCMHGTLNDDYCLLLRGTAVRKMHTIRRDAFRPINDPPLARIFPEGRIDVLNRSHRRRGSQEPSLEAAFEPRIALLKVHPSSDPDILDYYLGKGCKGFVIEGTGLGHVPTFADRSWIPAITRTVKEGIPVVVASQTVYGKVNATVYTNLRILGQAGAIPGEMLPETAFVKLGWVLAKTQEMDEVRRMMGTNVAGEIPERPLQEAFLR